MALLTISGLMWTGCASSHDSTIAVTIRMSRETTAMTSHDGSARLTRIALQDDANTAVTLPPLTKDAVAYVAQNPARSNEYATATFQRSVYVTEDRGKTWRQIARNGKGL